MKGRNDRLIYLFIVPREPPPRSRSCIYLFIYRTVPDHASYSPGELIYLCNALSNVQSVGTYDHLFIYLYFRQLAVEWLHALIYLFI